MKKKPQAVIVGQASLHEKMNEFFRKRGMNSSGYREKNSKIITEMKRRKALEIKEI